MHPLDSSKTEAYTAANLTFLKQWLLALVIMMLALMPTYAVTDSVEAETSDEATASQSSESEVPAENDHSDEEEKPKHTTSHLALEDALKVPPPVAGNITQKDTVIATKSEQINDNDIRRRIEGIFSEIEGLKGIVVEVNEGVVSLSGEAPNEKKAQQAINLANRVSDVVAVEDRINRTLDVQDNVTSVFDMIKQQTLSLVKALPLLLVAIMVFIAVSWFGVWWSRRESLWQRITPNLFVAELLSHTIKIVFIIIGLILGLSLMGAEAIIGTLLGGAGVIGIAVGFAVKDTIENYIASLMLSIRQPFMARDLVLINDQLGNVVRLTSRATILMTPDGNQLRIPNSEVFKATILNYTKNPERRFEFQLGVDANDDPIAAIKVGLEAINNLDFVLKTPQAVCIITEVGDSNIVLEFQVWVNQNDTDFFKARSIAIREAKHALEDKGFSLPEPIYKLRFNGEVEEAIKHMGALTVSQDKHLATHNSNTGTHLEAKSKPSVDNNLAAQRVTGSGHNRPIAMAGSHVVESPEKIEAKQRAKSILGNKQVADVLDARPDPDLMQKVEEEIKENNGDTDLLNKNGPQE